MKQVVLLAVFGSVLALGQTWSGSGSNGSDGALDLGANTPGVVANELFFDPVTLNLDADADNIYHFTTITVRDNIRVHFLANRMRRPGPVVFLASGGVKIQGILDFGGEDGHPVTNNDSLRRISIPGPGGYPGGVGGRGSGALPTGGFGPAGGRVHTTSDARGCPGGYARVSLPSWCTGAGTPAAYGTNLIQPLVGGSGGSGARLPGDAGGGSGGGAGGGAFRLSSTTYIVFGSDLTAQKTGTGCDSRNQYIIADGGAGPFVQYNGGSGGGAGGAIHLQAPSIAGCGIHLYARGGGGGETSGSEGRTRVDSTSLVNLQASPLATSNVLVDAPAPPNQPFLRITKIGDITVPASPRFDYATPDVLINSTAAVPLVFQANNIPVSTPVTLFITTDTGADITATVNLTGTLAESTATTNVTLPQGTARLIARAVW